MSVLVTPDEMRAAEQALFDAGLPPPDLMRRAAERMAEWLDARIGWTHERHAVGLVGPRNNGGDALVTLALLRERGWRCTAVLLGRESYGDLPASASSLAAVQQGGLGALAEATVILDGVYGIGGRAELSSEQTAALAAARHERSSCGTPLVAIDVPSGVDSLTSAAHPGAFMADVTLCLGLPKIGLVREPAASFVGELVVLDIGAAWPAPVDRPRLIDEADVRDALPRRGASAHKHGAGAVLVIGGAPTYYGAPRLSGMAALRSGAGLVALAVPEPLVPVIAGQAPELIFVPLPVGDADGALAAIRQFVAEREGSLTAAVVGPGLGRSAYAGRLLELLLDAEGEDDPLGGVPLVVDADGLNWLAARETRPRALSPGRRILTPHPGEMARLLRSRTDDVLADTIETARRAARDFGLVVVLKSGFTAVASPDGEVALAPRSTPELATAGTGDVLAGLLGGLLAQRLGPFDAARAAVYIGALAGRDARRQFGTLGVIATDVIDAIAVVMRELGDSPLAV